MSDILIYGFFGEDEAHRNFLSRYLTHQYPGVFLEDDDFRHQIRARNRDQVDNLLPLALAQKVKSRLDILFVTRDVDSPHKQTIDGRRAVLDRACAAHQPVVLMLPVQCIEHWLWYIKRHQEEPGKQSLLESNPRRDAKTTIYGDSKVVETQLVLANALLDHLDVDWLYQRVDSFKHFHNQVVQFLQAYSKTE
ncbi:hypothetical protein [Spirosoma rhododendri]|uniref:DUF4276 family protein n=1 Tax=Spirosoma rhododendri TaxID=2728024 RepID=A0A7L5DLL1_9BACT|nr:hypothetical protein [Spirosoma rhododendri]QJD78401.1 hypothetical protein HH216_08180 [Spirosoma rhododendri]